MSDSTSPPPPPPDSPSWFYSTDGSQRFETSEDGLRRLFGEGKIGPDTLVWREGLAQWLPLREARPEWLATPAPVAAPVAAPVPPPTPVTLPPAAILLGPDPGYRKPLDASALTSAISGGLGVLVSVGGFCCCFGFLLAPLFGGVAVIFGHMARSQAGNHPEAERDKQFATVGMILGYAALLIAFGMFLFHLLFVGVQASMKDLQFKF